MLVSGLSGTKGDDVELIPSQRRALTQKTSRIKKNSDSSRFSRAAKTGYIFVKINNVRYDGYDAIKKRLDEINGQLAL